MHQKKNQAGKDGMIMLYVEQAGWDVPRAHQSIALLWPSPVMISWNQVAVRDLTNISRSLLLL